jgi:hypothetical protein
VRRLERVDGDGEGDGDEDVNVGVERVDRRGEGATFGEGDGDGDGHVRERVDRRVTDTSDSASEIGSGFSIFRFVRVGAVVDSMEGDSVVLERVERRGAIMKQNSKEQFQFQ